MPLQEDDQQLVLEPGQQHIFLDESGRQVVLAPEQPSVLNMIARPASAARATCCPRSRSPPPTRSSSSCSARTRRSSCSRYARLTRVTS